MGYPWGNEAYPTFEKAEHGVNSFTDTFYREYDNMLYQARQLNVLRGNAKFDGMFIASGKDNDEKNSSTKDAEEHEPYDEDDYDDSYPSARQEIDAFGIALARAFVAAGVDDDELNYLVRDIVAILEDHVVSHSDSEDYAYGENAENRRELERYRETLNDPDKLKQAKSFGDKIDGKTVEEWYRDEIAELEAKITKFEVDKINETRSRCKHSRY